MLFGSGGLTAFVWHYHRHFICAQHHPREQVPSFMILTSPLSHFVPAARIPGTQPGAAAVLQSSTPEDNSNLFHDFPRVVGFVCLHQLALHHVATSVQPRSWKAHPFQCIPEASTQLLQHGRRTVQKSVLKLICRNAARKKLRHNVLNSVPVCVL